MTSSPLANQPEAFPRFLATVWNVFPLCGLASLQKALSVGCPL